MGLETFGELKQMENSGCQVAQQCSPCLLRRNPPRVGQTTPLDASCALVRATENSLEPHPSGTLASGVVAFALFHDHKLLYPLALLNF
jgi:hypothetical protein